MKLWKKILIILVIILLLLVIITVRKFMILTDMNAKNMEQQKCENVYAKVTTEQTTVEMYRKGKSMKQVIHRNNSNVVLTQLTNPEHRIVYTDDGNQKTMKLFEEEFMMENQNVIVNYASYFTLGEKIISSIGSKIKTEMVDGKTCYVISGYNTNFMYDENCVDLKLYIDQETGLAVKCVETIEEDGNRREVVRTYEYQFDTVTEEDVAELDASEYQVLE